MMQDKLQYLLAGLLVAGAAVSAVWMLLPARLRLGALQNLQRRTPQRGWRAPLRRLIDRKLGKLQAATGGCGSCPASPPRKPPG
jgi:uncharacterized iron-regulated membrane protein